MFKKIYTIICIFIFFANINLFSQKNEWHSTQWLPFIVYYQHNNSASANNVIQILQKNYPRLAKELDYTKQEIIKIFICSTMKEYRKIIGNNVPEWAGGVAVPSKNTIYVKTYDYNVNFSKTLIHELTHILLHNIIENNPIPRWLDEGLAVYYSDEKQYASRSMVSKAILTNSIIALSDIDKVLTFDKSKAQLAYQESYLAVIFIVDKFGIGALKNIIKAINNEVTIDHAFLKVFKMNLWDFEFAWSKYIRKKQRWQFLVDFDTYLWIFILLLFLSGFLIIRRRNRLTIKRWDEEEKELW